MVAPKCLANGTAYRKAFKDVLADSNPNLRVFLKGKDKREDIEKEFKKHKKDFSLEQFGAIVP